MLSATSQTQKTNTAWTHLKVESIVRHIEEESRMVVVKA